MSRPEKPNFVREIIAAFGDTALEASAKIGVPNSTLDAWKRKGEIPPWRFAQISAVADAQHVELPKSFAAAAKRATKATERRRNKAKGKPAEARA
jgi:hypothetical protein